MGCQAVTSQQSWVPSASPAGAVGGPGPPRPRSGPLWGVHCGGPPAAPFTQLVPCLLSQASLLSRGKVRETLPSVATAEPFGLNSTWGRPRPSRGEAHVQMLGAQGTPVGRCLVAPVHVGRGRARLPGSPAPLLRGCLGGAGRRCPSVEVAPWQGDLSHVSSGRAVTGCTRRSPVQWEGHTGCPAAWGGGRRVPAELPALGARSGALLHARWARSCPPRELSPPGHLPAQALPERSLSHTRTLPAPPSWHLRGPPRTHSCAP